MSNLYEITKKLALYDMVFDPDTGEWLNEDELKSIELERDEKIENLLLWAKNLKAEAQMVKVESERLKERYKGIEKKAERIEEYVASALCGEKFSTPRVEVKWHKSERVIVPDEFAVPDEFVNLSITRRPVKAEIKKYLKSIDGTGEKCEWATLETKNNMTVN